MMRAREYASMRSERREGPRALGCVGVSRANGLACVDPRSRFPSSLQIFGLPSPKFFRHLASDGLGGRGLPGKREGEGGEGRGRKRKLGVCVGRRDASSHPYGCAACVRAWVERLRLAWNAAKRERAAAAKGMMGGVGGQTGSAGASERSAGRGGVGHEVGDAPPRMWRARNEPFDLRSLTQAGLRRARARGCARSLPTHPRVSGSRGEERVWAVVCVCVNVCGTCCKAFQTSTSTRVPNNTRDGPELSRRSPFSSFLFILPLPFTLL